MTEVAFPLLGAAFVVLIVLPFSALVAKAGLAFLERDDVGGPLHALNLRYLLLTGSSVLPLAWLLSAGLHQAESGRSALACLFAHDSAGLCLEPGFFVLTLGLAMLALCGRTLRAAAASQASASPLTDDTKVAAAKVDRVLDQHPELAWLRGRVRMASHSNFAIATQGYFRPAILVSAGFVDQLSEEMLASALGHEAEHVRAFDPLRYLLLTLALALNPCGRLLLKRHVDLWYGTREAHCDREAVMRGAAPLPLAEAIVKAARPTRRQAVALGAHNAKVLQFRVAMLLAFAERRPFRCCHRGPSAFILAFALPLVALLLPHQTGTAALDVLHTSVEQALTFLLH